MKLNYELIYKVRKAGVRTDALSNLVTQYQNDARRKAEKEHAEYRKLIEGLTGRDDFEVTNIVCMAEGIAGHVYSPNAGVPKGVGKRVCLFCGLDDFDD